MELDCFWSIIEESRCDFDPDRTDGNMDLQVAALKRRLSRLAASDIATFDNTFRQLFRSAYDWDLWAAGYVIEGGCSDDGFTDFRYWLLSMGQEWEYEDLPTRFPKLTAAATQYGS